MSAPRGSAAGRRGEGSSFDRVVEALEARGFKVLTRRARDVMASCPAHQPDRTPSLHVWWNNGSTSVHCFSGCTGERPHHDPEPVLDALGLTLADLFDEPLPERDRRNDFAARPAGGRPRARQQRGARTTAQSKGAERSGTGRTATPKAAKPDLGKQLSSTNVLSYIYRRHDPDQVQGPGYWERVDRIQQVYEHGVGKSFLRYHWAEGQWRRGKAEAGSVLFNWPAVERAITAGQEVWLAEGEKDALSLIALGLVATTNISGAGSWDDDYTAALRGAHLVVCLDRDKAGAKRGQRLRESLSPVVASLRMLQPPEAPEGSGLELTDVTDVLEAGLGLQSLQEVSFGQVVELDAHRPAGKTGPGDDDADDGGAPPPKRRGGGGGGDSWDAIPNTRPSYLYRQGAIVERTWRSSKDDTMIPRFQVLIDGKAWIERRTYLDDGSSENAESVATHDFVVAMAREDPETGEVLEQGTYRVAADLVANARWPEALPWGRLVVGQKRAERDKAWAGLEWTLDETGQPIPEGSLARATARKTPIYTAPGWRQTEAGPIYVHATGAIGADGAVEVESQLDGEFAGMALPEPCEDRARLREAFLDGLAPLMELPGHIVAPLLGVTMWASVGGAASHVTHLWGAPGSAKTFAARSVLQLFNPTMQFEAEHQEMASARETTPVAMARLAGRAKDTVLFVDDFAPDDTGGAVAMQAKLAGIARKVHNHSKRSKATRTGSGTENDPAPRGSVITSGELCAAGSAETRCLNVPVLTGELNHQDLQERIENPHTAAERGLLGASFLQWAAQDLPGRRTQLKSWTSGPDSYRRPWQARLRDLPHDQGVRSRIAGAVACATAGIRMLHEWLAAAEIAEPAELAALWSWAIHGLDRVARAQEVESTDPAEHFLATLRTVLGSRKGYLADHRGDAPAPEDLDFAAAYGWSWQPRPGFNPMSSDPGGQWMHTGDLLGEVSEHTVKLLPEPCIAAARSAAARADQRWADTVASLTAAMDGRGWLQTGVNKQSGRVERRPSVRVCGVKDRPWVIDRRLFDGEDPEDGGAGRGSGPGPLPGYDPHTPGPASPAPGGDPDWAGPGTDTEEPVWAPAAAHHDQDVAAVAGPLTPADRREPAAQDGREAGQLDGGQQLEGRAVEDNEQDQPDQAEEPDMTLEKLVAHLRSLGGDALDERVGRGVGAEGGCAGCGQPCALYVGGVRVHVACLMRELARPAAVPAAPAAPAPAVLTRPEPAAAATRTGGRPRLADAAQAERDKPTPQPAAASVGEQLPAAQGARGPLPMPGKPDGRWQAAAAVLDVTGVYLPSGRRLGAGQLNDALDVLAVGQRCQIGFRGGPGHLWLTEQLCDQLGLLVGFDDTVIGFDAQREQLLERLGEAGRAFLAPALEAGWTVDGDVLKPLTRLRRDEPDGGQRVLELVVEPYQWVWDTRLSGLASGEEGTATALPSMSDPAKRWAELARRAGRAVELLGVQFRMSAGAVGAALFDTAQNRRRRAAERGVGVDAGGRNRARVVDRAGPLPELPGYDGYDLEVPFAWSRRLSDTELAASWAHGFDGRKQYLPAAKSVELGYCTDAAPGLEYLDDPERIGELIGGVEGPKLPFGLWLITLPAWDEPRMPAPHPRQRPDRAVRAWVSTPSLRLLLEDPEPRGGAGYRLEELAPEQAWVWPEQARLLDGHWYTTLRKAIEACANGVDPAMETHLKLVYAGHIGRMSSPYTARGGRPWHHQPMWRLAIIAAARSEEWRKIRRASERGLWPVVASADEVVYLASGEQADQPDTVAPAADNGRMGALRHSRSLRLDDVTRTRLRERGRDLVTAGVWTSDTGTEPDPAAPTGEPAGAEREQAATSSGSGGPDGAEVA